MTDYDHRIKRDGNLDIVFDGEEIGSGSYGTGGEYRSDWNRGTDVSIYLTRSKQIVTDVTQWSRWQGEDSLHRAAVHSTAADALQWLVDDCGGSLGPASKEAWERACKHEALAGADVEEVA